MRWPNGFDHGFWWVVLASFFSLRPSFFLVLVLSWILLCFALSLQLSPVDGVSEARELHLAKIIHQTSEWVLPTRSGIIPSKPPLYHWCAAGLAALSNGFNVLVGRLPSVFFGLGCLILSALLSLAQGAGAASGRQDKFLLALLNVLVLSSTFGFLVLMGVGRVDMPFAFTLMLALYFIFRRFSSNYLLAGEGFNPIRRLDLSLFFVACGFAVLARGPLGIVLPGLICFAGLAYVLGAKSALRTMLRPCWGWVIFLAISLSWYISAAQQGGLHFIWKQIVFENTQRFVGGEHINAEPFWFYLPSFLRSAFPWSLLFIVFIWQHFRERQAQTVDFAARLAQRIKSLGAIWVLVGLVFLSLSTGKRHSYLLPLYPGMSLFLAWKLHDIFYSLAVHEQHSFCAWLARLQSFPILLLLVLGLEFINLPALMWDSIWLEMRSWFVPQVRQAQLVLLSGWLLSRLVLRLHNRKITADYLSILCALTITVCSLLISGVAVGSAFKNRLKGLEQVAQELREVSAGQAVSIIADEHEELFDVVLFYLGKEVTRTDPDQSKFSCNPNQMYLARKAWLEQFLASGNSTSFRIEVLRNFNQTLDQARGRTHRATVLFRCG